MLKNTITQITLLCFILVIALFSTSVAPLLTTWLIDAGTYSHGFLLLFISGYLVYTSLPEIASRPLKPNRQLATFILGVSLTWSAAEIAQIQVVQQLTLPLLIWLSIAFLAGINAAKYLLIPVFCLYFAIPIWDVFTPALQTITVAATENILNLFNIPVIINGNLITIPSGIMEVAGGCSGLNYLLTSISLALIYSHVLGQNWAGVSLTVLLSIFSALIANWVRVSSLVLIGHASEMQHSLINNHHTFGWVIFAAFLVPLFGLLLPFLHRFPNLHRANQHTSQAAKQRTTIGTTDIAILFSCLACGPLLILVITALPTKEAQTITLDYATSHPQNAKPYQWQPDFPNTDQTINISHQWHQHPAVSHIYFYGYQKQSHELVGHYNHLYTDNGWRVKSNSIITPIATTPYRRAILHHPRAGKRLFYYRYYVGGYTATSDLIAKLYQLISIASWRTDASLIGTSIACASDCSNEHLALEDKVSPQLLSLAAAIEIALHP